MTLANVLELQGTEPVNAGIELAISLECQEATV